MSKASEWNCIYLTAGRPASFFAQGRISANEDYQENFGTNELPLLVLVPADRSNAISVDLPQISGRKLEQALRWAAEDVIAGPVEDQHVAPIRRDPDGRLRCMVSSRQDMQQWLDALPKRPQKLLPDAACLPWQQGQLTLMPLNGQWLLRWAETGFDRVDPDLLDLMLPELPAASVKPREVICYWPDDQNPLPAAIAALDPDLRPLRQEPLALLAKHAIHSPINLMHGEYSAIAPGSHQKHWRRVAMLGIAAALLLGLHAMTENWLLSSQTEQLDHEISRKYRALFPEVARPQRHRFEAEQIMAALSGNGNDAFLGLTSRISELVSGADGVRIDALSYANHQIRLTLKVPGTADIEALQQQLQGNGLDVEVEQLQVMPDGPQAILRIRQAGSS